MKFFLFECILKPLINTYGISGLNKKKALKGKKNLQKRFSPTPSTFFCFLFYNVMPCTKDDFNQKCFERDLALLIIKDMVQLSFVKVP
jgi:hypothetical protein